MEKVQWNSIDKKQNGLKYSKNDKSSTIPCPMNNKSEKWYIYFYKLMEKILPYICEQ